MGQENGFVSYLPHLGDYSRSINHRYPYTAESAWAMSPAINGVATGGLAGIVAVDIAIAANKGLHDGLTIGVDAFLGGAVLGILATIGKNVVIGGKLRRNSEYSYTPWYRKPAKTK